MTVRRQLTKKKDKKDEAKSGDKPIKLKIGGETRTFDINDPKLPKWIDDNALRSGGYPYPSKMKSEEYEETLERLQIELVKLQYWLQDTGGVSSASLKAGTLPARAEPSLQSASS